MSSNNEDILKKILTSLMKQKSDIDSMIDQITNELNGSDDKLETRDRVDESKKSSIIDKEDQDDDEKSDEEDAYTEDDLVNKSIVELKDIYKKIIGKAARGPSASKSEWLIGKILSKSTKEVESKSSDMKKVAMKKVAMKNSKLVKDETDEDLDKIIFEGVEYNVTKLDNGEIWASNMDGKTVGYYKNDIIVFKSYDDQIVHHEQRC